jgi:hypothetical protein
VIQYKLCQLIIKTNINRKRPLGCTCVSVLDANCDNRGQVKSIAQGNPKKWHVLYGYMDGQLNDSIQEGAESCTNVRVGEG